MSLPSSNSKLTFHNTQNNIYKPTTFPLSFYTVWLMPSILTLLFFTLSLCWPSFCLKTMTHSLLTHPHLSSLVFILCGIAINSKKYIFGLHPQGSSEHRPQKILKEDSVKCVLVMLIRWVFGKDLVTEQQQWWGWVPVEPNRLEPVCENQVLLLGSESGVEAQFCRTELLTYGIWCYLQVLSELSWVVGYPASVWALPAGLGEPPAPCWNWQQNPIFPCLDSQMGLSQTFFISLFKCHLFGQTLVGFLILSVPWSSLQSLTPSLPFFHNLSALWSHSVY